MGGFGSGGLAPGPAKGLPVPTTPGLQLAQLIFGQNAPGPVPGTSVSSPTGAGKLGSLAPITIITPGDTSRESPSRPTAIGLPI